MKTCDYLIHAKWIITCEEEKTHLENYSISIENGKILAILPTHQAKNEYTPKKTFDYSSHVILPGFINAHTHLAMNYFRGLADDLALMDWLNNHIWPAEQKWLNEEFVKDASLFAMAEMIRCGTTCFNDMYFFPHATAEATEIAGIRGHIGMTIINVPTAYAKNTEDYFAKGLEFLSKYKNHPFIKVTLAPHSTYTVDEDSLIRVKKISEDEKLKITMHIQETSDEIKLSVEKTGLRPMAHLEKLGLVSPDLIAVHMTQINEEDLTILKNKKANVVHCPESNMKLASGTSPVAKMESLGVNVALGTDGSASNNDLDMLSEMRTAAFLAKLSTQNPQALAANETIKLATINGAKALGIQEVTGSLTVGKSADFIAINLDEIETLPLYHPSSQVVYAACRNQVTDVWVAGKQLMKNRELLTLDLNGLKEKARYWNKKIK